MLQGFRRPHWLVLPVLLLYSLPLLAADASNDIAFVSMSIGLLGGLSIFLFGMETMSDALKRVTSLQLIGMLIVIAGLLLPRIATTWQQRLQNQSGESKTVGG